MRFPFSCTPARGDHFSRSELQCSSVAGIFAQAPKYPNFSSTGRLSDVAGLRCFLPTSARRTSWRLTWATFLSQSVLPTDTLGTGCQFCGSIMPMEELFVLKEGSSLRPRLLEYQCMPTNLLLNFRLTLSLAPFPVSLSFFPSWVLSHEH